jgi:hypothetical protein
MGWVKRGSLSVVIAEQVYGLKPGQTSPVTEDEAGFQVLKLVDTQPANPPSLESMRRVIRNQLVSYRVGLGAARVQSMVASHMGMVPDSANIAWACKFFPKPVDVDRNESGVATVNVTEVLPEFTDADTARSLARWKDGRLSLGRFLTEYGEISPFSRPNVTTPEGMTQMVENIASEPYKARMAVDYGFDKDPMVVYQVESHYSGLIVRRMYSDSIEARTRITPEERRAEYDAHPERYAVPEVRRFATILRPSTTSADSLAAELRAGGSAPAVIVADSVKGLKSGALHEMRADDHGEFKKIVFEELKPGEVTTMPTERSGYTAVVQLLSVSPARLPRYEEVQVAIDDNLRAEKSEGLLHEWLARLKQSHSIEMHPELVMRIRLVDPTMM